MPQRSEDGKPDARFARSGLGIRAGAIFMRPLCLPGHLVLRDLLDNGASCHDVPTSVEVIQEDCVAELVPTILLIGGFLLLAFALRFASRGRWH
jgi:hypothetical protein